MNLFPINAGNFKLDGGAMFGVVPKAIWQKSNPADEANMCTWAMRCLLIEDGNKPEYLTWLRKNINTAWGNRDVARGLTTKNYKIACPTTGVISCYDASGIVALMQVIPPAE